MYEKRRSGITSMQGFKIPFKYDGLLYPVPVLYVSINNIAPHPFILDTGTNLPMVIDEAFATQNRLDFSKQDAVNSPIGTLRIVDLRSIRFCGIDDRNHLRFRGSPWASVADLGAMSGAITPEPIAGIIGAPAFRDGLALFDFDNQILTLTWATARSASPKAKRAALREANDVYMVDVSIASSNASLLIDTGASTSSLSYNVVKQDSILNLTYTLGFNLKRGFTYRRKAIVRGITIAGLSVPNAAINLTGEIPGRSRQGSLGIDILSRFNVLLDLKHRQLTLLPRAAGIRPPLVTGITGIEVGADTNGGVYITKIHSWSPASRTSLRVGDRLLAIDGHQIAHLPLVVTRRLLSGNAGTEARLLIQRNGEQPTIIRFKRLSEFDRPINLRIDCELAKQPNEPLNVVYVPPSSKMQGILQPGDSILEIDGAPTASMEAETVFDILTEPSNVSQTTVKRGKDRIMVIRISDK